MPWRYFTAESGIVKGLAAGDTTQIDKLKELYEEGKISVGTVQKVIGEVKENPRKDSSVLLLCFSVQDMKNQI